MTVVALGHRFPDLAEERLVLGEGVELIDANRVDDVAAALQAASAVLLGTQASLDAAALDAMRRCKVVVRYGIGVDNIDVDHAAQLGIAVANVPDYCSVEVSDHAMALVLQAARRLGPANARAREGVWDTTVMTGVRRLSTQTIGLIGYGRIGRLVAHKARAFGMQVLVTDPYAAADSLPSPGAHLVELEQLLRSSDFISLHCPLTADTRRLINAERLALMRPSAWLINTSRGALIDLPALLAGLDAGTIGGAALDVLPDEPVAPDHPILHHPKVFVTPHVAWFSAEAVTDLRRRAAEVVATVIEGGWPNSVLNGVTPEQRWGAGL